LQPSDFVPKPYVHRQLVRPGRFALANMTSRLLTSALWWYQAAISPFLGPRCRFVPSCSNYAQQAIARHGAGRGSWMAVKRLLRCHPFHPGGWDPVR